MKKVLVVGAEEFIGRRVVAALADSTWATPVAAVVRSPNRQFAKIEQVRLNASDASSQEAALRGVDAVVNCLSGAPKEIAAGAQALFGAAARAASKPRIVHVSSMSVYGSARGDIMEDAPRLADLGPYSSAKLQAETIAERYADTVILRPGCEYGPHGELWSGRIARWLFAHRIGDLGAAGDGFCNLVHIDDLAAAVVLALQDPLAVGRAYNLSMPNPPTWNDYLVRYARALGAVPVKRISGRQLALETKVLAAPLKALEIAAHAVGVGEVAPPPIPPSLLRLTRQEICLVATRAQLELGWTCRPLAQGLAQTAAWFNQARSGVEPSVVT